MVGALVCSSVKGVVFRGVDAQGLQAARRGGAGWPPRLSAPQTASRGRPPSSNHSRAGSGGLKVTTGPSLCREAHV